MSYVERLRDLVRKCLFTDGEDSSAAIIAEGAVTRFGFHPGRIAEHRDAIGTLVAEIVTDDFLPGKGGGTSFLNLCMARDGSQWGEHRDCDELICLAMAAGKAHFCAPRDFWPLLPGGMPYVMFNPAGGQ